MLDRPRPLTWVGNSYRDFTQFPEQMQDEMGFALYLAQIGDRHRKARPLHGFGGASVLEIADDHDGSAYRAVYTVKFADRVYVLHAFQKKSKRGIATPRTDMKLIQQRLQAAEADYSERRKEPKK